MDAEAVKQVVQQGIAFAVLIAWLAYSLREIRRLQRLCNRRTEDYLDLITEVSGLRIKVRKDSEEEDLTNRGA